MYRAAVILILALTLGAGASRAEVVGPLLAAKEFEVGVQYRQTRRNFSESESGISIADAGVTARYGLTGLTTLSVELMAGPDIMRSPDDYDSYDHQYYLVGAGLQMKMLQRAAFTAHFGIHYAESFVFSNTEDQRHRKQRRVDIVLAGQYDIALGGQWVSVFAGPGYFFFRQDYLPDAERRGTYDESEDNRGGIAGVSGLIGRHVVIQFSAVYAGLLQGRAMVSLRL